MPDAPTGRLEQHTLAAIVRAWRRYQIPRVVIGYIENLVRAKDLAVLEDFALQQERNAEALEDRDPLRISYEIRADLARQLQTRIKRQGSPTKELEQSTLRNPASTQGKAESGHQSSDATAIPGDAPLDPS